MPGQIGHDVIAGLNGNLECLQIFRIVEKVVMKVLHNLSKFLTVNHKADVHE